MRALDTCKESEVLSIPSSKGLLLSAVESILTANCRAVKTDFHPIFDLFFRPALIHSTRWRIVLLAFMFCLQNSTLGSI
jgi:hypothetical protein